MKTFSHIILLLLFLTQSSFAQRRRAVSPHLPTYVALQACCITWADDQKYFYAVELFTTTHQPAPSYLEQSLIDVRSHIELFEIMRTYYWCDPPARLVAAFPSPYAAQLYSELHTIVVYGHQLEEAGLITP